MLKDKVIYKIFDKTYLHSSHIYAKHKYQNDKEKIVEITKNQQIIAQFLGAKNILFLKQVHDNHALDADIVNNFAHEPEGDAAVTTMKLRALAIQTADCVPLLLASLDGKVISAAHCGWRSTKLDIIKKTVELMRTKGAEKITALIGPAIRQSSYEVSEEYYQSFIKDKQSYQQLFLPSPRLNHYMFDLPGFVKEKLRQSEITAIEDIAEDTYIQAEKYPSYRRFYHLGKDLKNRESILSVIMIK